WMSFQRNCSQTEFEYHVLNYVRIKMYNKNLIKRSLWSSSCKGPGELRLRFESDKAESVGRINGKCRNQYNHRDKVRSHILVCGPRTIMWTCSFSGGSSLNVSDN